MMACSNESSPLNEESTKMFDNKIMAALKFCQAYRDESRNPDSALIDSVISTGSQVMDFNGTLIVASNRNLDGMNIIDMTDSNGQPFVKNIISKAKGLNPSEIGTVRYVWQNKGGPPLAKFTRFMCIPEWKWILYSGGYEDNSLNIKIN